MVPLAPLLFTMMLLLLLVPLLPLLRCYDHCRDASPSRPGMECQSQAPNTKPRFNSKAGQFLAESDCRKDASDVQRRQALYTTVNARES